MSATTSTVVLWLFVMNLGLAFGAGIYEHRIVVTRWLRTDKGGATTWNAAAAREDDTGRRFWVFTSTVPLTLLTLANLFAAWHSAYPIRGWWLAAGASAGASAPLSDQFPHPRCTRHWRTVSSPSPISFRR